MPRGKGTYGKKVGRPRVVAVRKKGGAKKLKMGRTWRGTPRK